MISYRIESLFLVKKKRVNKKTQAQTWVFKQLTKLLTY